jgi:hypothetical protein
MEEWALIIAAGVGGLLALLGGLIKKIFSSRALDKEYKERRREEQLRIQTEQIRRDIESIEEAADTVAVALRELQGLGILNSNIQFLVNSGELSEKDAKEKIEMASKNVDIATGKVRVALTWGGRRAFSLGPEIRNKFMNYDAVVDRLHKAMLGKNMEDQNKLWIKLLESGGALQEALRSCVINLWEMEKQE